MTTQSIRGNSHTTSGVGSTVVDDVLERFWDFVDITDNLEKLKTEMQKVNNGFDSLMSALAFLVITALAGYFMWYFDLESTMMGLEDMKQRIIPTLPTTFVNATWFMTVVFTLAPMVAESFMAGVSRAGIQAIKWLTLTFTIFDLVTDIPRTKLFVDGFSTQFDQLPMIISTIVYWLTFMLLLLFSTVGYQVVFFITFVGFAGFVWKAYLGFTKKNR